jgi:hypothetical protein
MSMLRKHPGAIERALGHPWAFIATGLILVAIFSATFFVHPDRVAPGDDPAYYTWRTEALMSENPSVLLDTAGPRSVLAGGYRVSTPIIGAMLRQIADVDLLSMTIFLTVAVRVIIALLLAGFAYGLSATTGFYPRRPDHAEAAGPRDPLVFHAVAFGAASLLLTPPFFGYLDNLICLMFLSAALFFIEPLRTSWPARLGFTGLLTLAGLTHPTTLVFFCLTIGAMAAVRLLIRRFDLRSVVRDDGPLLVSAFCAALITYAIWRIGAWGPSASLTEAALPPPASSSFFMTRLTDWMSQLRPLLNGPLFLVGLIGLLAAGRRAFEDELSRVVIVWLLPLIGVLGFVGGFAYPYYRFLNTTLAWVLLVGLGAGFLMRMFIQWSRRTNVLPLLGVIAIVAIILTNFTAGLARWNEIEEGWLSAQQIEELRSVREALKAQGDDRPVVFVMDTDETEVVRIYGFMKLNANVSRSGLPHGYLDRGYTFVGSVEDFAAGRPTEGANDAHLAISQDTLDFGQQGIAAAGEEPILVLASAFNNPDALEGPVESPDGATVWTVADGEVVDAATGDVIVGESSVEDPGIAHVLWVVLMLAILLIPGFIWFRSVSPTGGVAEALGLVPALSIALLILCGFAVVSVFRSPLAAGYAWLVVALAVVAAAGAALAGDGGTIVNRPRK